MNLIGTATEKLERCNRRLLGVILRFGLPRYGKKLMLLVGVFSGLRHLKAITPDELERLNATLGLASCPEALEFPAMVSKRIWKGIELEGVISTLHLKVPTTSWWPISLNGCVTIPTRSWSTTFAAWLTTRAYRRLDISGIG